MVSKKVIPGLLLLVGLALAGGCLNPIEEPTVPPVSMSVPTSTATATETPTLSPAPIPGHPAPDFALPDLAGNELRLGDLKGQVILLNFWTTW